MDGTDPFNRSRTLGGIVVISAFVTLLLADRPR